MSDPNNPTAKPTATVSASDIYAPTPTQDENDRAASGEHVMDKEPDGSPEQENTVMVQEQKRLEEAKRKQMEAKPTGAAPYQTKTVEPAKTTTAPPTKPATTTKHE